MPKPVSSGGILKDEPIFNSYVVVVDFQSKDAVDGGPGCAAAGQPRGNIRVPCAVGASGLAAQWAFWWI